MDDFKDEIEQYTVPMGRFDGYILLNYMDELSRMFQAPGEPIGFCWVLVHDTDIVAFARTLLKPEDRHHMFLEAIEVREGFRGKRYSTGLISMIEVITGMQIVGSGDFTSEGYEKLHHRVPTLGNRQAEPSLSDRTFVSDWDTLETV